MTIIQYKILNIKNATEIIGQNVVTKARMRKLLQIICEIVLLMSEDYWNTTGLFLKGK